MKGIFPPEWRTQSRRKRRFYATYMRWLERIGFVVVLAVLAAFIFAFRYKVDDLVSADGVKIEPFATPIVAAQPTLVVRTLVNDFDEVRKGQPLMEVVEGDLAIEEYQEWKWVHRRRASDDSPVAGLSKPSRRTVVAPIRGTYRIDPKLTQMTQEKGAILARIVDYNDLRLSASLAGQTAPAAKVGQSARVSAVTIEPDAGTLFRGYGAGTPILSGRILEDKVQNVLQRDLVGRTLSLRDDVPLKVSEIEGVQIDATIEAVGNGGAPPLSLDPPGNYELQAQVIDGKPVATAQVAILPSDVNDQAQAAIRQAIQGRTVRQLDGSVSNLKGIKDVRMVVTVKADQQDGDSNQAISGVSVKRTFDATLKIVNPPTSLIRAVRDADRKGKAVTARVELRTGSRPIALLLLKKS